MDDPRPWLALAHVPGMHAGRLVPLLDRFGSVPEILRTPPVELSENGLGAASTVRLGNPDWRAVDADLAWLSEGSDHFILTWACPGYPDLLREIADPPIVIYGRGRVAALGVAQVAVVGSRRSSHGGRAMARRLAADLVGAGLGVTSGLALGIDAAAHAGALDAAGTTVAVAGSGLDRVYPHCHRALAESISTDGAVCSEFPPGTPPRAANFPRRNRLISGLALGVVVVEAAERSGSLITARLAGEQGREVFAVPGSVSNPVSRGCHRLLRDGATLVESVSDILIEVCPALLRAVQSGAESVPASLPALAGCDPGSDERVVIDSIEDVPIGVDVVVERTGLTPERVSSILLALELRGIVVHAPGLGYVRTVQ